MSRALRQRGARVSTFTTGCNLRCAGPLRQVPSDARWCAAQSRPRGAGRAGTVWAAGVALARERQPGSGAMVASRPV